jgi:hypothetical protein
MWRRWRRAQIQIAGLYNKNQFKRPLFQKAAIYVFSKKLAIAGNCGNPEFLEMLLGVFTTASALEKNQLKIYIVQIL